MTLDNWCIMLYYVNMDKLLDLIEELEIYRLENRISERELAKTLRVSYNTVNRWFNGRCKPNKIQTYHIKKLLCQARKTQE